MRVGTRRVIWGNSPVRRTRRVAPYARGRALSERPRQGGGPNGRLLPNLSAPTGVETAMSRRLDGDAPLLWTAPGIGVQNQEAPCVLLPAFEVPPLRLPFGGRHSRRPLSRRRKNSEKWKNQRYYINGDRGNTPSHQRTALMGGCLRSFRLGSSGCKVPPLLGLLFHVNDPGGPP